MPLIVTLFKKIHVDQVDLLKFENAVTFATTEQQSQRWNFCASPLGGKPVWHHAPSLAGWP